MIRITLAAVFQTFEYWTHSNSPSCSVLQEVLTRCSGVVEVEARTGGSCGLRPRGVKSTPNHSPFFPTLKPFNQTKQSAADTDSCRSALLHDALEATHNHQRDGEVEGERDPCLSPAPSPPRFVHSHPNSSTPQRSGGSSAHSAWTGGGSSVPRSRNGGLRGGSSSAGSSTRRVNNLSPASAGGQGTASLCGVTPPTCSETASINLGTHLTMEAMTPEESGDRSTPWVQSKYSVANRNL